MASNALACSASRIAVSSNRVSISKAPSPVGFAPERHRSVMLRPSSSRRLSLVVRAVDDPQPGFNNPTADNPAQQKNLSDDPSRPHLFPNKPALLGSPYSVRNPWQIIEDDDKKVVLKVILQELNHNDVIVRIVGKKLTIVDATKKILDEEITFLLPDECLGSTDAQATLGKGVLIVTVGKFTNPNKIINVPVKSLDERGF